jgi:hypothetical protein
MNTVQTGNLVVAAALDQATVDVARFQSHFKTEALRKKAIESVKALEQAIRAA